MSVTIAFVDAGQGDCTVAVDNESHKALVIDCPPEGVDAASQALIDLAVEEVDVVIATHTDDDHLGGAVHLARQLLPRSMRVTPDKFSDPDPTRQKKLRAALGAIAALPRLGVEVRFAVHDDAEDVGAVRWTVLAPMESQVFAALATTRPNHASLIVRLEAHGFRALIGGDADGQSWRQAIDRAEDLHADVFRLPHHGASLPTGTGMAALAEVLDAVGASYHVVSVGTGNPYDHPREDTLQELGRRASTARVLCTEVNRICLGGRDAPFAVASARTGLAAIGSDRSGRCPCAGTVVFTVNPKALDILPSRMDHDLVINALDNPMCRPAVGA